MDPASAAALVALLTQGGPWAVVVVVVGLVLRAWRSGEFISKTVHEQIVAIVKERLGDWADRYKASADATMAWRQEAERAAKAAEQAQADHAAILNRIAAFERAARSAEDAPAQHAELLARLDRLLRELVEFRQDLGGPGPPPRDRGGR